MPDYSQLATLAQARDARIERPDLATGWVGVAYPDLRETMQD